MLKALYYLRFKILGQHKNSNSTLLCLFDVRKTDESKSIIATLSVSSAGNYFSSHSVRVSVISFNITWC